MGNAESSPGVYPDPARYPKLIGEEETAEPSPLSSSFSFSSWFSFLGLAGDTASPYSEFARLPEDREMVKLLILQKKLYTRLIEKEEHVALLRRLWNSLTNSSKPFQRFSPLWEELGFSSSNPGPELRGGGQLGLECLVYFSERYPAEARMMIRPQHYPWALMAVKITNAIAQVFHLRNPEGRRGPFPCTKTVYWHVLEDELDFFNLFCFSLFVIDDIYIEACRKSKNLKATWAQHPEMIAEFREKLLSALSQGPQKISDLQYIRTAGALPSNLWSREGTVPMGVCEYSRKGWKAVGKKQERGMKRLQSTAWASAPFSQEDNEQSLLSECKKAIPSLSSWKSQPEERERETEGSLFENSNRMADPFGQTEDERRTGPMPAISVEEGKREGKREGERERAAENTLEEEGEDEEEDRTEGRSSIESLGHGARADLFAGLTKKNYQELVFDAPTPNPREELSSEESLPPSPSLSTPTSSMESPLFQDFLDITRGEAELSKQKEVEEALAIERGRRLDLQRKVETAVEMWKARHTTVRSQLAHLSEVLWPGARWKDVEEKELVEPERVKRVFRKAMVVVHPDRCVTLTEEQQLLAQAIHKELDRTWDIFDRMEYSFGL